MGISDDDVTEDAQKAVLCFEVSASRVEDVRK